MEHDEYEDEFEQEFVEFCNGLPCVYLFAFLILCLVVLIGVFSSSLSLAFVVILCFLPTALVLYFTYLKNHLDSVLPAAVVHSFCWGAIGSFPVLPFQILSVAYFTGAWDLLGEPRDPKDTTPDVTRGIVFPIYQAYLVCATTEEILKYLVVTQFPSAAFVNRPYGIVILCIASGLGFATMENLGYVLFDDADVSYFLAILRGFLDVALHSITAILIGVRVAAKEHEIFPFHRIMALPFLVHGTYDVFLMIASRLGSAYPLVNILPVFSFLVVIGAGYFSIQQLQSLEE